MTSTTTTSRDARNAAARERRADERWTLDYAARIRAHVTGERSANQERVLAEADAIQRRRDARNARAQERRLRQRQQREYAQRAAERDERIAAEWHASQQAQQRAAEQRAAERDAIHAAQRDAIAQAATPELAQAMRYFGAAERNPAHAARNLRLAWEWQRRAEAA